MSTQTAVQNHQVFNFSGYTLVPADETYKRKADAWTKADEFHRETTPGSFWINTEDNAQPGVEKWVLLDAKGDPVFFFRLSRIARVDIQFAPGHGKRHLLRNRNALISGFSWLKWIAARSGIAQLIFQTSNPPLAHFSEKVLGFRHSEGEFVFGMETPGDGAEKEVR